MPANLIVEPGAIDLAKALFGKGEINRYNPQRYEFEQLDGILILDFDKKIAVGYKLQKADEFWVKGHIPGRPLMPGVLMTEMGAQLCSFYYHKCPDVQAEGKFFGFGGLDKVKFRGAVVPGDTLIMAVRNIDRRSRMAVFESQGFVNNKLVYEGLITGVIF